MKTHKLPRSEGNFETGVRAIFLITLIGLIAGITGLSAFGPQPDIGILHGDPGTAATAPNVAQAPSDAKDSSAGPSTYFPAQFAPPKSGSEEQSPTF